MNLLEKIITLGILVPSFVSCSDKNSEKSDDSNTVNSWYEDAETAEKQLLTSETIGSAKTIIFDASTTNTTLIGNNRGSLGTITGAPGNLVLTNPTHSFNLSGITSVDDINTLKGSNLTSTDIVTITVHVSGLSGGKLRGNGIQFGLGDTATFGDEDAGDVQVRMQPSNSRGTILTYFNGLTPIDTGYIASTAELSNGFTAILVADAKGYTFTLESVGNTSPLIVSGTFTEAQFIDIVGSGHFYYSAQQYKESLVSSITQASIEITSKP